MKKREKIRAIGLLYNFFLFASLAYGSVSAGGSTASLYECVQQETSGKLTPRLECSDFEADRSFAAIGLLFKKGKNSEGITFLETLVAAKPFNTSYRIALIEKRIAFSQLDGVEDHIRILSKLNPNSESVLITAAKAMESLGKVEEAIHLLSVHLENHASNHEARRLRAQFYEKTKQWKQAQTDWHVLEQTHIPTEEKLHRLMGSLKERQFEAVLKELEPLVTPDKGPFDLALADILAQAYAGVGRHSDADGLWKLVLHLSPEDLEVRLRLSKDLIENKQYDEAILHLSYILSKKEGHQAAVYQLSRVRILQERYDLAGQALAKISALDPAETWSVQAQALLWQQLGQKDLAEQTLAARRLGTAVLEANAKPEEERAVSSNEPPCLQHLVQKGETLETISLRYYKTHAAWNTLLNINAKAIGDPHHIREGMVLWIPQNRETGKCGE